MNWGYFLINLFWLGENFCFYFRVCKPRKMETLQEVEVSEETRPSDAELEETHVERELNLLLEMPLRMEQELSVLTSEIREE